MYKTKITQWKLKKNYTAAEKEQLARDFKAHRDSGKGIPSLTLRNRPAKLDRIRRFCKQEKILEEICDALQSDSPYEENVNSSAKALAGNRGAVTAQVIRVAVNSVRNSPSSSAQGLTQTLFDPERPFSTTSSIGRIELILLQTKIHHQSRFGSGTRPDTRSAATRLLVGNGVDEEGGIDLVVAWVENMIFGVGALVRQKSAQGWRMINEACEMTHKVLEQQPTSLFRLLFFGFKGGDWTFFPGLRTDLLRFFTKSSAGKLGCNHPISIVLYHLQEQQIFADAVRPVLEVLVDAFGENLDPANDDDYWNTRIGYCVSLRDQREYAAAESHGLRFLKQSEEAFGRLHQRTRDLLHELACIHYHQGHYGLAEIEYQDVVQRGREDLGNKFPDAGCIYALRQLAWIYEDQGDFAQSEECWRAALTGTIDGWGMEDQMTIYTIIQLEESFKNQGMDPEAWLRQNLGISCI
jgi:tetratricopeptide (TPR) repeat protein